MTTRRLLDALAPALAAALMLGLRPLLPVGVQTPSWARAHFDRVKQAAEAFPYRVGDWVGTDVEAPPAAVKLLKPNVLMQRRFVEPATGRTVSVLFVHCGDTRDMQGHYPPICYKNQGWGSPVEQRRVTLRAGRWRIPATDYVFRQFLDGRERALRIVNFFALPGGRFAADMDALDEASRRADAAGLGAAQVQIIAGERIPESKRLELAQMFAEALAPALQAVREGGGRD